MLYSKSLGRRWQPLSFSEPLYPPLQGPPTQKDFSEVMTQVHEEVRSPEGIGVYLGSFLLSCEWQ